MNKKEIINKVAEIVRVERIRKKLSQEQLAELAGVSTKYINSIENEKANPSIVVVISICRALNISLGLFM